MDDNMFSHDGTNRPESKTTRTFRPVRQVAEPGANSAVSNCILYWRMWSNFNLQHRVKISKSCHRPFLAVSVFASSSFIISPHGIAMSKGLYFTAVFFSFFFLFFFFRRLISEVTERISTKLGHMFTYNRYLKDLVRTPRAFTPTGWGQKPHCWDRLWTLTEHISARNMLSTIGKKLVNLQGLPYMPPPISWTLVQKRLRTVGEFLRIP